MIIVEGPDGAGKTTLIRRLSQDLDMDIAARVVGKDTRALVDIVTSTEERLNKGFQETLYDRFTMVSGPIYDAVMGRTHSMFADRNWMIARTNEFYNISPVLIYCLPPLQLVMLNVSEGEDDNSAVVECIEPIYQAYLARAAIDLFHLGSCFIYDYTIQNYDGILERVDGELIKREL